MSLLSLWIYLFPIVLYLLYKWGTKNHDYFEKQGIFYIKPLPIIGSNFGNFFKKQPLVEPIVKEYNKYKSLKLYGSFQMRQLAVVITDPKICKQIGVKDFDHFVDHQQFFNAEADPVLGNALFMLTGQKWRDMRATLSPAFTGSKMRQMFDFVNTVGQQTALTMKEDIAKGGEKEFEFKSLVMKFAVDVIASCAFGIEVNSFASPDNDFYKIAQRISNANTTRQVLIILALAVMPRLMKLLGVQVFERDITDFIREATLETMKMREEKGIVRHDMINLLMEARKGQLVHNQSVEENAVEGFATVEESDLGKMEVKRVWDDDTLAGQTLVFILGGFDTVATTMSFLAYELALNPDVQQTLYEEIYEMNQELDGKKISYEQLQGLKYLDQTVSETMRKWPASPITDRVCTKDYDLEFDGKKLHILKDTVVVLPIHCFHHDPEYFPQPDKFNPDRFSQENRKNINPDTYMPFGIGPRNCIGSRFALMEMKTIFYYLLLNFSIEVTSKTTIPFEYEKAPFAVRPLNGFWLALKPRQAE